VKDAISCIGRASYNLANVITNTKVYKHTPTRALTQTFFFYPPTQRVYASRHVHAVVSGAHTIAENLGATCACTHNLVCPCTPTNFATHTIALLPRVASGFMGIQAIERCVGSPGMFVGQISLQDKLFYPPRKPLPSSVS